MIGVNRPTCSTDYGIKVRSCSYSPPSRQLTLYYATLGAQAPGQSMTFYISDFKNPATTEPMTGFSATVTDSEGFTVARNDQIELPAVTQPAPFTDVQSYFSSPFYIGYYAQYNLELSVGIPLPDKCYVKLLQGNFFDDRLTEVKGTGFLGNQMIEFIEDGTDLENGILVFEACKDDGIEPTGTL